MPNAALAVAVFTAMKTIQNAAVHTSIPAGTPLPFFEIGNNQLVGEDDAGDFYRAYVEVTAYAKTSGETKIMAGQAMSALKRNLTLDGFTCHEHRFDNSIDRTERVGSDVIHSCIVTFEYLLQERL